MKLKLIRKYETDKSTIGKLYVNDEFFCHTLEDPGRKKKIWGKTCIWTGKYIVKLRKVGLFNNRYKKRFPNMHGGMLHITGVKQFKYILIHIGNFPKDTHGCVLVGSGYGTDFITGSTNAYKKLYPIVLRAFEDGEDVTIEITNDKMVKR